MKLNSTLQRIQELMDERGWKKYRLARESGLSASSINSMFANNNHPTIPTLIKICKGFNISLSEFFSTDKSTEKSRDYYTKDEKLLIEKYRSYDKKQQSALLLLFGILTKSEK